MGIEKFGFEGKRALVVGGASGMGNAAAVLLRDLGAEVEIADVREPVEAVGKFHSLDLRSQESVDHLVDSLAGSIDVVLSCAGVSDGMAGLPQINFIGHRHLIETAIAKGLVAGGSAIVMIASIGGMGWPKHLDEVNGFLDTPDYASASTWMEEHPEQADYNFSKQAMITYCARMAPGLSKQGIRINCVAPGPTMTPLMDANEAWQGFEQAFQATMGRPGATPDEQAYPLVFLASDAAAFVSGSCLIVDSGFINAGIVGALESPIVDFILS